MQYPKTLQPIPKHAKKVFEGVIFSIWQWEQEMFDGTTQVFEKAKRRSSVGVLPVTKDNKIVITTQRQPSMDEFVSLVGGIVDPGEEPSEAASRELLEEVGMKCEQLDLWYSVQPITKVEWPIYIFIARGAEQVTKPNLDSGEKIEMQLVDWTEFLSVVAKEDFRDKEIALRILQKKQNPDQLEQLRNFIFK